MANWEGNYTSRDALRPSDFTVLTRQPGDMVWEDSYQYDAHGRGRVIEHIRATFAGRLRSETPQAGFVGNAGLPCREDANGAKPVWIWWADVAPTE